MRSTHLALVLTLAAPPAALPAAGPAAPQAPAGAQGWDCAGGPEGGSWDCRAPASPKERPSASAAEPSLPEEPAAPPGAAGQAVQPTPLPVPVPESTEPPPPPPLPELAEPPLPLVPPLAMPPSPAGQSDWLLPPVRLAAPGGAAPGASLGSPLGSSPGPSPGASPGATPGPGAGGDDSRLYEGLPWDYCGPRVGLTGLGGAPTTPSDRGIPVNVAADRAVLDHGADLAQLSGGVEIVQGDQRVEAERADYHRGSGEVTAVGGVYVEYPGARLLAQSGRYNLNTKEGALEGVSYRMADTANLRGTAAQAALLPGDLTHYRDITYTTCPPGRSDWSIRASDLLLDHPEGLGTARHARILLGPVPVLYSPWLQFPIDDRRRSGLLIPTIGTSNETGLDITVPYYWNIAPNLDATFFPRLMSSRGIMLGAEVRHLASFQELSVEGEVIPEDAEDPQAGTRGALHIEQIGHLGPRWYSSVDYTSVSDDNYLTDFGNRLDVTSTRNLPQRGDLIYFGDGYTVLTRVQDFQTVDPTVQGQFAPYAQMPHVELIDQPKRWGETLEYDLDGSYDYFDHSAKVHGSRGVALPSLRLPLRRSYGYLTPRARAYAIGYELTETDPDQSPRQSYLIPSLDIDSKLIFERETSWFGTGLLQTLEPRLYYVLTPYADQSQAPLFDTTELDFSFASLFRPNRFTGYDRIGDENRLTFGLTSRSMATESGRELFRASLGQIYYFADRRVQLAGDTPSEDGTSSVAGELAASLGQDWDARASVQWNPHSAENELEKRVLTLRYAPQDDRILNLAYRYNLGQTAAEHYEDTDLSFRFPLGPQVKLVGRWLYSLANDETVDAFAGIELGRCCWRLRILGRHLKTSANASGSTSIMLQLELAGLGAFGNSIDKLLEQGIYGYGTDR